jgi:hypothetical protein
MQKVHARIATKDITWQLSVHLVVTALSHAHLDMHKTLKGKRFVFRAHPASMQCMKARRHVRVVQLAELLLTFQEPLNVMCAQKEVTSQIWARPSV